MNKRNAAAVIIPSLMFLSLSGAWARPWNPNENPGDDSASVLNQASQNAAGKQAAVPAKSTGKSACPSLSRADLGQKLKVLVLESAAESRGSLILSDKRVSSGVGIWLGAKKAPAGIFNCVFPYKGQRTRQSPAEVRLAKDMSRWVSQNAPATAGAKLPAAWVGKFLDAARSDSFRVIGKSAFKSKKEDQTTRKKNNSTVKNKSSAQSAIDKAKLAQAQIAAQNKALEGAVGQPGKVPSPAVPVNPIQTPILSPIPAGWREAGLNKMADVNDLMTNHGWISAVSPLPNGHADPGIMSPNHHEFYDVNTQKVYVFTPISPVAAKASEKPQAKPAAFSDWRLAAKANPLTFNPNVEELQKMRWSEVPDGPGNSAGLLSPDRTWFYNGNSGGFYNRTKVAPPAPKIWKSLGQNKAAKVGELMKRGWISAVSPIPGGDADPGIMSPNHHEFYDINTQKIYVLESAPARQ